MPYTKNLNKAVYVIEFRNRDEYPVRHIEAYRLEGWTNDYAFFDADDQVFMIWPRELVANIFREPYGQKDNTTHDSVMHIPTNPRAASK